VKRVGGRDRRGRRHRVADHRHEILELGRDVTRRILREPFRRQVIRHEAPPPAPPAVSTLKPEEHVRHLDHRHDAVFERQTGAECDAQEVGGLEGNGNHADQCQGCATGGKPAVFFCSKRYLSILFAVMTP
jgi:hypothetical protein